LRRRWRRFRRLAALPRLGRAKRGAQRRRSGTRCQSLAFHNTFDRDVRYASIVTGRTYCADSRGGAVISFEMGETTMMPFSFHRRGRLRLLTMPLKGPAIVLATLCAI